MSYSNSDYTNDLESVESIEDKSFEDSNKHKVFYKGRMTAKNIIKKCSQDNIAIAMEGNAFEHFLDEYLI